MSVLAVVALLAWSALMWAMGREYGRSEKPHCDHDDEFGCAADRCYRIDLQKVRLRHEYSLQSRWN